MKILSLLFLLVFTSPSYSAGGGGGSSPFIPIYPPIIVNILDGDSIRHMQVIIEIKLFDKDNASKIDLHKGPMRHALILLLSSQQSDKINSSAGKEALRAEALETVQGVLEELEGDPIVEALYFTNFVVQ